MSVLVNRLYKICNWKLIRKFFAEIAVYKIDPWSTSVWIRLFEGKLNRVSTRQTIHHRKVSHRTLCGSKESLTHKNKLCKTNPNFVVRQRPMFSRCKMGEQIGRFLAQRGDCLLWAVTWKLQTWKLHTWKFQRHPTFLGHSMVPLVHICWHKIGWKKFLVNFSQTHLVALHSSCHATMSGMNNLSGK
jgi:hypothetical protein